MNSYQVITHMDQIWVWTGSIQEEAFGRACWVCELAPEHTEEKQKGEW